MSTRLGHAITSQRMPRKMRHAALRSALSVKASQTEIVVLDKLRLEQPKTKEMAAILGRLVGNSSALIILTERDEQVERSRSQPDRPPRRCEHPI